MQSFPVLSAWATLLEYQCVCPPTWKLSELCHLRAFLEVSFGRHNWLNLWPLWLNSSSSPSPHAPLLRSEGWGLKVSGFQPRLGVSGDQPLSGSYLSLFPPSPDPTRSHLFSIQRHSYYSGDTRCSGNSVAEAKGGKRSHIIFYWTTDIFLMFKSKLVYLRDEHWWGFLKTPTKTATRLEGHCLGDAPLDTWKQGQDLKKKKKSVFGWLLYTSESPQSSMLILEGKRFQVGITGLPLPESCFWALNFPRIWLVCMSTGKHTSEKLNGHTGRKQTKLQASAK